MKDKREMILKLLKKKGQLSTGKIALHIKSNQWKAEEYLKILEKEDLVTKLKVPSATYWSLKERKNPRTPKRKKNDN